MAFKMAGAMMPEPFCLTSLFAELVALALVIESSRMPEAFSAGMRSASPAPALSSSAASSVRTPETCLMTFLVYAVPMSYLLESNRRLNTNEDTRCGKRLPHYQDKGRRNWHGIGPHAVEAQVD